MKKYLLFLIVFFVSGTIGSIGGNSSPKITGDFYYIHPQNTTTNGLVEIADIVINKSLVVDDKAVTCMA